MPLYRRNLPHWHPEGATLFITWRLYGTMPIATVSLKTCTDKSVCATRESPGARFARLDIELERMKGGPKWLSHPAVAGAVVSTILRGDNVLHQYRLRAYVLMPNHVHLLMDPLIEAQKIMKELKGVSAREVNRILDREGELFWQDESYDHWVRDEQELGRICFYIEHNPVRAGLVNKPENWRWSSAWSDVDT